VTLNPLVVQRIIRTDLQFKICLSTGTTKPRIFLHLLMTLHVGYVINDLSTVMRHWRVWVTHQISQTSRHIGIQYHSKHCMSVMKPKQAAVSYCRAVFIQSCSLLLMARPHLLIRHCTDTLIWPVWTGPVCSRAVVCAVHYTGHQTVCNDYSSKHDCRRVTSNRYSGDPS